MCHSPCNSQWNLNFKHSKVTVILYYARIIQNNRHFWMLQIQIMLVMPTRSLLPGTRCFGLSLCCDLFCPNCDAQIAQNQPKLCPNCSREKKTSHIFYSQDRNISRKSRCFWRKKMKKFGKQKNESGKHRVFSNKIFITKKLVFKPTQHHGQ